MTKGIYQKIFQSSRNPMFVLDTSGCVQELNDAAAQFLRELHVSGDSPKNTEGSLPWWIEDAVSKAIKEMGTPSKEYHSAETLGGFKHFETEVEPIADPQGGIQGFALILHDITELKQAEIAVRYRSDFARLISEISSGLLGVLSEDFDEALAGSLQRLSLFVNADSAFLCQFEDSGERLTMTHSWTSPKNTLPVDSLPILDSKHMQRWMEKLKRSDIVTVPSISEFSLADGIEQSFMGARGIQSLLEVPMSHKGQVTGFMGLGSVQRGRAWTQDQIDLATIVAQVLTNAFQHERSEEALARERRLLRTVVDNLPDYIYAKDTKSRFVLNNKAHLRLLRAGTQEEIFGKTDYDIFPKDLADQYYADEQNVITTGQSLVNREESVITEDGNRRWLLTTKVALYDSDGNPQGIVGMSRDITLRIEMAQELESHAKLLEQANSELHLRNQELDEFTYIASHDLQEPLRKLSAFSDALREDMKIGDQVDIDRDLAVITSAAQRMQKLVRDLLALSRSGRQSMAWDEVDLNECVALALEALEMRVREERAEIRYETLPTVPGDKTLLVQLYQNLIGNALKFHGKDLPLIEITAEQGEEAFVLGVADKGIGIKEEYFEQIFAPFKRLHSRSQYEGTGIGLAICRKIVERHGGTIWVESRPGPGTLFKFTLATQRGETAQ